MLEESRTKSRSGVDRHQRAQDSYEEKQKELAEILAFAEKRASTPRRRYEIAEEHVAKRRNKQLTRLFRTTVDVPPDEREGDAQQEERDRELATSFQALNTNIKHDSPVKADKIQRKPSQDKMAEEVFAKIAAKLQDLSAQLAEMKEENQELREELRKLHEDQEDPTQVAEKAADRANMAYDYAAGVSKAVVDTMARPKPVEALPSKLQPYKGGDFNLWKERFLAQGQNLTEERKMNELLNLLQGRAEDVVMSKKRNEWNSTTLLNTCQDRLVGSYGRGQLELALMELGEQPEDEPTAVMTRIEEITRKADSAMETKDLNILKRNAFMRLIRSNKSMYHYINRKAASHSDPYEALRLAKEHIRDFGHESQAVIEMTKRMLQLSGVQVPEISMSSGFLQVPVAGQSLTRSTPNISDLPDAGKPAATRKESFMNYNDMAASEERLDARFLSKGHKPTPDEITYRWNQLKKFQRDFGAGLIYPGYRNEEEKNGDKNSDRTKK